MAAKVVMVFLLVVGCFCRDHLTVEQVSAFAASEEEGQRCLGSCLCYENVKTVNCSGKDYDYVPYGMPEETLTLDLSHNTIRSISSDDLKDISQVTNLDISYNQLKVVGGFKMVGKLRVLKITNNANTFVVFGGTFSSLSNLEELDFQYANAQGILSGVFTSQQSLGVLNIDWNNIFQSAVTNSSFDGLVNLRELSMGGTYLYEIPVDSMQPFRDTLKKLSMQYTARLTQIGSQDSQRLDFPNLEVLDLSYSAISLILPGAFARLPKLKLLDLTGNSLPVLSPGAFFGLSNLQFLNLSVTGLVSFPLVALQPLNGSLLELRLSWTYFSEIRSIPTNLTDSFLGKLESLIIENGNLEKIAEDSFFNSLKSLKYLRIADTQLQKIPTSALQGLDSLVTADFSENPITSISVNDIPDLEELRHLILSGSDIINIDDDALSPINLHTLTLKDNKLENLTSSLLAGQSNLSAIDISNNQLQRLEVKWFSGKSSLAEVLLTGNLWNCDCEMIEFYNWMTTTDYQQIDNFETVICDQPRSMKGFPLPLLQEYDLSCDAGDCPSSCICTEMYNSQMSRSSKPASFLEELKRYEDYQRKRLEPANRNDVSPLDKLTYQKEVFSRAVLYSGADCTGSRLTEIPKVPNTTEYLNVAQNLISRLRTSDFNYMHNLNTFIASDNRVSEIENGTFTSLELLEIIYLNKNQIGLTVDISWFSKLFFLQELRMDDNLIREISPSAFSDLKNLEILELSKNRISALASTTFTGLQNLKFLNLASNQISSIHESTFHILPNLKYLYLYDNYLSSVPPLMVQPNQNLEFMELSENTLGTISDNFLKSESLASLIMEYGYNPVVANGSFSGLPNLQVLRLSHGQISQIGSEAFNVTNGNKLRTLDLSDNYIQDIPLHAFAKLDCLESLGISGNQISVIPSWQSNDTFLPNLKTLYLAENSNILELPKDSFVSVLLNLTALVMNGCNLKKIPVEALSTTQLQYLVLDKNPITVLGDDVSLLTHLKELQLSEATSLETISEGALHNLLDLERLILSDSQITNISGSTFSNLKNLEVLDISNNRLTQPRREWFADLESEKIKSILLYGNPWKCDCSALDYKKWLDNANDKFDEGFVSITCVSPQMYKGWSITEIDSPADICSSTAYTTTVSSSTTQSSQGPSSDCAKCTYYEDTKTGVCNDARLQSVPRGCFPSDIEKLDLSGNQISEIKSDDFLNLHALYELILMGNRIEEISGDAFQDLQQLSILDLSSNNLQEVPSSALVTVENSLLVLKLDNLRISRIAEASLPLRNLIELSMISIRGSGTLPITIEDYAFAQMSSLRKLDMSMNQIASVGKNTLIGLHELEFLNMTATRLTKFPYETFWRVPKLTELILDDNSILSLGASTVPILESLQRFSIRNNSLASISDDSFINNCVDIQVLDFGVSSLTKIPSSLLLSYKPKLNILRLDYSRIEIVRYCDFPLTTTGLVDLGNSRLRTIGERAFAEMDQLLELLLNDNMIDFIDDNVFSDSGLKHLDLSNNALEYISCAWIDNLPDQNEITINLEGNRFNCTCGMVGYRHYIDSQDYPTNTNVTGDVCDAPAELSGSKVESVSLEKMQSYCGEGDAAPSFCATAPTTTSKTRTTKKQTTAMAQTTIVTTTSRSERLDNTPFIFICAISLLYLGFIDAY